MKIRRTVYTLFCGIGIPLLLTASLCFGQIRYRDAYVPGEMIVSLKAGRSVAQFHARHGTWTIDQLAGTNKYRVGIPGGLSVEQEVMSVSSDPDLLWAKPNFLHQGPEIRQGSQAFIDQGSQAFIDGRSPANFYGQAQLQRVRLNEAHQLSLGTGIRVAVIDTGIDFSHPLFAGRILGTGYDFVDNDVNPADQAGGTGTGHGTFVAGLVLLSAPGAAVLPVRAFAADGRGTSFNIARAIQYAADQGVHIINMSFGLREEDEMIRDAMYYARQRNVFMVASAGNAAEEAVNFPATDDMSLAVTSTNGTNDFKALFANYGLSVDAAAPGTGLYSAYPGNRWAWWDGTSFSTALISGEAALLLAPNPHLDRSVLRAKITGYGAPLDELNNNYANKMGTVRVDFRSALEALSLFEVSSVYDNKNQKTYLPGGKDGDEPKADLNTIAEEFKFEIEAGPAYWWQMDFNDPDAHAASPARAHLDIHYRSEEGWQGNFVLECYTGTTLVSSTNVPVDSRLDAAMGKGRKGVFRWNLTGVIRSRAELAGVKIRLVNQSANGRKLWVTFANIYAK